MAETKNRDDKFVVIYNATLLAYPQWSKQSAQAEAKRLWDAIKENAKKDHGENPNPVTFESTMAKLQQKSLTTKSKLMDFWAKQSTASGTLTAQKTINEA